MQPRQRTRRRRTSRPAAAAALLLAALFATACCPTAAARWDGQMLPTGGGPVDWGVALLAPADGQQSPAAPWWDSAQSWAQRRSLQQFGCGQRPIVIAHGPIPPTNIRAILDEMPPLPKVEIRSASEVQLVSLTDPSSCIRRAARIAGALIIWDDGSIPDLSALSALRSVSGPLILFGVDGKSGIKSLAGLERLQSIGGLAIAHINDLQTLKGLEALTIIGEDLVIWDNDSLVSLKGLGPITQLYRRLWIDTNPLLPTLAGLEALQTVDYDVVIRGNDMLRDLNGLDSLQVVGGEVSLINNFKLASTAGLKSLARLGISLVMMSSPSLIDLDGFARVPAIPGDLVIYETAVPSLAALRGVKEIGLSCVIGVNSNLTSLEGLEDVRSIGAQLSVAFNPVLETLKGLENLETVGADLLVNNNPVLRTLASLPTKLTTVGALLYGDLKITDNPELSDLAGLGAEGGPLTRVAGTVTIARNSDALPPAQIAPVVARAVPQPITVARVLAAVAAVPAAGAPPGPAAAAAVPGPAAKRGAAPAEAPTTPATAGSLPGAVAAPAAPSAITNPEPVAPATGAAGAAAVNPAAAVTPAAPQAATVSPVAAAPAAPVASGTTPRAGV